ncbi:MAG: DNA repair protein RecN [Spirochaetota bacterium]
MLERLWITNFAIIAELTIEFSPGFCILTGETGAGKSILIGALGLLLGEKGDVSNIRTGADEASVAALVSVHSQEASTWLADQGIEDDDGAVLIRRTLKAAGRGTITIQNVPVTRGMLREFSLLLFNIHGQHDHQTLLQPASQLKLLDRYAHLEGDVRSFSQLFASYVEARKEVERLQAAQEHQEREQELLQFAVDEIDSARLTPGEDEEIAGELQRLSQHERLSETIETVRQSLHPQSGATAGIREGAKELESAAGIDNSLGELSERLSSARYELEDIFEEIRRYHDQLEYSPQRLDELNQRQQVIRSLKKKYGASIEDVLVYRDEAADKLEAIEHSEETLQQAQQKVSTLSKEVEAASRRLSEKRGEVAAVLEPQVQEHIAKLGMPNAEFRVQIEPKTDAAGKTTCSSNGIDTVNLLLSANLGEPLKPISSVASGGELSRIMLALKSVCSETEQTETLIFDEIDAGIGGTVAVAVGQHLKELAASRQVLCITHLASVAAKADAHLVVEKHESDQRTETSVYSVSGEERVAELARMLSGTDFEEKALEHARMLIER